MDPLAPVAVPSPTHPTVKPLSVRPHSEPSWATIKPPFPVRRSSPVASPVPPACLVPRAERVRPGSLGPPAPGRDGGRRGRHEWSCGRSGCPAPPRAARRASRSRPRTHRSRCSPAGREARNLGRSRGTAVRRRCGCRCSPAGRRRVFGAACGGRAGRAAARACDRSPGDRTAGERPLPDGGGEVPLGPFREVDDRPGHAGHRDPVDDRPVLVVDQARAVQYDARARSAAARGGHFDPRRVAQHAPKCRRRPVAQQPPRPVGVDRRKLAPARREVEAPDGVHARVKAVEPSGRDSPGDRVLVQPHPMELVQADDAVLPRGQRPDELVRRVWAA
jgi:hypothetical protein